MDELANSWPRVVEMQGREMKLPASNMRTVELLVRIAMRKPCHVILEPGDATRYELLLHPLSQLETSWGVGGHLAQTTEHLWLVTRPASHSDVPALSVILDERDTVEQWHTEPISRGNIWSREWLALWLGFAFEGAG